MVNEHPGFDDEPYEEYQIYDDEDNVYLTTRNRLALQTILLHVNTTIHEEAAPILYGKNDFVFDGQYCTNDLYYFERRLTRVARDHIRNVKTVFPEILDGDVRHEFSVPGSGSLRIFGRFPSLRILQFRVFEDIMTGDVRLLRKIRDSVRQGCQIVLKIGSASIHYEYDSHDMRAVRIGSGAIAKMRKWGWVVEGDFELVDKGHALVNEGKWSRWLQKDRERGLRSGLISEPSRKSLIWWTGWPSQW